MLLLRAAVAAEASGMELPSTLPGDLGERIGSFVPPTDSEPLGEEAMSAVLMTISCFVSLIFPPMLFRFIFIFKPLSTVA